MRASSVSLLPNRITSVTAQDFDARYHDNTPCTKMVLDTITLARQPDGGHPLS
jgi:hypothetical protein